MSFCIHVGFRKNTQSMTKGFGTFHFVFHHLGQINFYTNWFTIFLQSTMEQTPPPYMFHPVSNKRHLNILPDRSVPKITALTEATDIQWKSESTRRLVLISAVTTPSLDNPSQMQINSGQFSKKRATTSPFWYPCALKKFAILFEYSSTSLNDHILFSNIMAAFWGCLDTVSWNISETVRLFLTCNRVVISRLAKREKPLMKKEE